MGVSSNQEASLRRVEDLPLLEEMESPDWGTDVGSLAARVFALPHGGLMLGTDGSAVAYRNRDLRELGAKAELGNLPSAEGGEALSAMVGPGENGWEQLLQNHVFAMNPPLHGPSRKLFSRHFTKGKVVGYEERAEAAMSAVLDEVATGAEIDFKVDVAAAVAAKFWSDVVGLDPDEAIHAAALARDLGAAHYIIPIENEGIVANHSGVDYLKTVSSGIMHELERGNNQLLNEMAADLEQIETPGRPRDLGMALGALLFDGFHTMTVGLSNVVHALLEAPSAHAQVRADQDLVANAFSEGIRLHPPVSITQRFTLADVTYDDVLIPTGTRVSMLWLFGNRDPEAFEHPDEFDLLRPVTHQATFGGGFHICPGRSIARVIAEAVIRGLTAPGVEIAATAQAPWVPGSMMHELIEMPVAISRR